MRDIANRRRVGEAPQSSQTSQTGQASQIHRLRRLCRLKGQAHLGIVAIDIFSSGAKVRRLLPGGRGELGAVKHAARRGFEAPRRVVLHFFFVCVPSAEEFLGKTSAPP